MNVESVVQPRKPIQVFLNDLIWRSKEEAAATEGEICKKSKESQEWEPSLLEVKGLLIDIQTSIANITKEN